MGNLYRNPNLDRFGHSDDELSRAVIYSSDPYEVLKLGDVHSSHEGSVEDKNTVEAYARLEELMADGLATVVIGTGYTAVGNTVEVAGANMRELQDAS